MSSYRLRNWSEYERALRARGSVCLWLTPEVLARVRRTIPDLTEQELRTNVVFCVAEPR